MTRNLVCFTASFPFYNREAFFEAELKYLSKGFERIYIIPTYNPGIDKTPRETPANVIFSQPVTPQGFRRVIKGVFNLSPISAYLKDFFRHRVFLNKHQLLYWTNSLLVFRAQYAAARKILKQLNPDETLLYSYWAEAPLFTTKAFRKFKKAARMHGGDFYLNRNQNYLPLRKDIYRNCHLLLPISNDIRKILIRDYQIDPEKIEVSYLGVQNKKEKINPPREVSMVQPLVLVSCSNAVALKRIHKIIEALHHFPENIQVVWHHFGDGPLLETLKQSAAQLPPHVKPYFHGWVKPQQLFDFYAENHVDWLINTSKYEGVPVSIMEALSFGIPVIATDVGATNEVVLPQNGYLLPEDFQPEQISRLILHTSAEDYEDKRINARKTWKVRFDAEHNYHKLVQALKRIK